MNVCKMMGRLYAQTVRYDTGRGGIPELTPQDLAAAVGMVSNDLAREVFCWIWWPASSKEATAKVRALVLDEVLREFNRRYAAADAARARLRECEARAALTNRDNDEAGIEAKRARRVFEQVHSTVWPATMATYPKILDAVVEELRQPRHCPDCDGRGTRSTGGLVHDCDRCGGTGHVSEYNTWRAQKIGTSESRFRATWLPIYQWVYSMVEELAHEAARKVAMAIADEAETA